MEKRLASYLALGGVYGEDDVRAATAVIAAAATPGGNFFPLPEEKEFQDAFAAHEGAARAVAVNSAGTALDLCMMALGVGLGDEVITTPLTFICSATTAMARGARVVFADIDRSPGYRRMWSVSVSSIPLTMVQPGMCSPETSMPH